MGELISPSILPAEAGLTHPRSAEAQQDHQRHPRSALANELKITKNLSVRKPGVVLREPSF